jgi:hypothetical protein
MNTTRIEDRGLRIAKRNRPSSILDSPSSPRSLRLIAWTYAIVVILLGISLYLNVKQAIDSSSYSQQSYKNGLRDGETFARNQILRADLEAQIIQDQRTAAAKEKL